MKTVPQIAAKIGVSALTVRRRAARGEYPYIMIGNFMMLDLDEIMRIESETNCPDGIGLNELSRETGLSRNAIMRAVRDGWMPYWRAGRANGYRFSIEQVTAAIESRKIGGGR